MKKSVSLIVLAILISSILLVSGCWWGSGDGDYSELDCDTLEIEIRPSNGCAEYGIYDPCFCVYSNQNADWADVEITFKNGQEVYIEALLEKNYCDDIFVENAEFDDIQSVKATSQECPKISDIVTDISYLENP